MTRSSKFISIVILLLIIMGGVSKSTAPVAARQPSEASNANSWSNEFAGFGINADTRGLSHPLVWNNTLYAAAIDGSSMTDLTGVVYWDGRQWLKLGALNGYVEALTIHQDKLYAGGVLKLNGQDVDLVYWDGITWTGLATVTSNYLMSLASYQNELYLASGPLTIDGQTYQNIARWNGSEWNPVGTGVDGTIFNIVSGADGIYVSGAIEPINSQNQGGIVRWDGSQWHDVGGGITGYIMDLQLVDHQVIIGGAFTSTTNLQMHNIAAWNGTTWNTFGNGINNPIESVLLRDQGLFALGKPIGINVPLYVWNGSDWEIAAQASYKNYEWLEFPKYSLVEFDNDMYALGDLYIYDQYYALNRLVWRDDHWESMTPNGLYEDYRGLLVSNIDETIYAYSQTQATWGSGRSALIRFDVATGWQALVVDPASVSGDAQQLEVISDTISLIQANRLYQTAPVSTTWASVTDQTVFGMARDQAKLYVAGDFEQFAGVNSTNLVVWHNGQWQTFAAPASFSQVKIVDALNGVVYISDGVQLARWDGTQWQMLATGVNRIRQLEATTDGVYVAGTFSSIAGVTAHQIAYWNGSRWSALSGMINGPIVDLEMGVDGLYVAGTFNGVAGVVSPGILRWNGIWNSVGGGVQHRDVFASGFSINNLAATPTRMYLGGIFDSVGNTYESSRIAAWMYGEPGWVTPTYAVYAPLMVR